MSVTGTSLGESVGDDGAVPESWLGGEGPPEEAGGASGARTQPRASQVTSMATSPSRIARARVPRARVGQVVANGAPDRRTVTDVRAATPEA